MGVLAASLLERISVKFCPFILVATHDTMSKDPIDEQKKLYLISDYGTLLSRPLHI